MPLTTFRFDYELEYDFLASELVHEDARDLTRKAILRTPAKNLVVPKVCTRSQTRTRSQI